MRLGVKTITLEQQFKRFNATVKGLFEGFTHIEQVTCHYMFLLISKMYLYFRFSVIQIIPGEVSIQQFDNNILKKYINRNINW